MSRDLRPFSQWPVPKSTAAAPASSLGVLVEGASGGWAVSTEPGAVAEASLVASTTGGVAADDSLPGGGRVRVIGTARIGIL